MVQFSRKQLAFYAANNADCVGETVAGGRGGGGDDRGSAMGLHSELQLRLLRTTEKTSTIAL